MSSSTLKKQFNIQILLIPSLLIIFYFAFTNSEEKRAAKEAKEATEKAAKAAEEARIQAEIEAEGKIIDLMTFGQLQIKDKLKDGESAKFAKVYISTSNFVCGEVNSKNSFGGFAGYQRFISAYPAGITTLEENTNEKEFKKSWDKFCVFKITTPYAQSEHNL